MSVYQRVQQQARRNGAPATYALIGLLLATFVISWAMKGVLFQPLQFFSDWSQPWGLFTYPFASAGDGRGLFWFLVELYWLFWVGTAAENDLGTQRYVLFWLGSTVLAGLFIWLGLEVIYAHTLLPVRGGPGLPIAALTVVWGLRNPSGLIKLFAIIPISGMILAWLTVALTLFGYGSIYGAPLMGLFAVLHLGVAALFATNRLPGLTYGKGPQRAYKATELRDPKYFDDVKRREKEREERERLRKMFEDSVKDDTDK